LKWEVEATYRIGEDLFKLNERLDCEGKCREAAVGELSADLHEYMAARATQDDTVGARVLDELSALRGGLAAETADRMHEDEAIVHAINEYTRALQEGLRIVGSS
jgi:hypothetical protein